MEIINGAKLKNFTHTSHFRYKSADEFITIMFYISFCLLSDTTSNYFLHPQNRQHENAQIQTSFHANKTVIIQVFF